MATYKNGKLIDDDEIYVGTPIVDEIYYGGNAMLSDEPAIAVVNPDIAGVPSEYTEKVTSSYKESNKVTTANKKKSDAASKVESITSADKLISDKYWDALNSKFETPESVKEADAYLAEQLAAIQSGKTSYSDQVRDMIDKIMNRESFSYDVDKDPLFQQALASAMNSGKQAMQDTIGQASALTGGYGSSYATSVGNQAYNAFVEDAYNNLPQYYQMALEAYQAEGENMLNQYGILSDADMTEYQKMLNAYDSTFAYRNQAYNEAYTQFRDSKTDAYNSAQLELAEHGQLVSDALTNYDVSADYADKLYEQEYNKWKDEVNNILEAMKLYNEDYWKKSEFNYKYDELDHDSSENALDRQHDSSESALDRQHDSSENALDRQHDSSENALDRQHDSSENALDRQHDVDTREDTQNWNDANREDTQNWNDANREDTQNHDIVMQNDAQEFTSTENDKKNISKEDDNSTLTNAEWKGLIEAYTNAGGGEKGMNAVDAYLGAIGKNNLSEDVMSSIATTLNDVVIEDESTVNKGSASKLTAKDGDNFTVEYNGKKYNNIEIHGKVSDSDKVQKLDKLGVGNNEAFIYDGKMYVKSGDNYYICGATMFFSDYEKLFEALLNK